MKLSTPGTAAAAPQLLKRTTSRCPVCHAPCPGEVWRVGGSPAKVWLKRSCPEHGEVSVCVASDARFYWVSQGDPRNVDGCGCGTAAGGSCTNADGAPLGTTGRNSMAQAGAPFEVLSTCLALIEVVNSCNLPCPVCYADAPAGAGQKPNITPLGELQRRIQGVIDRKGKIEILQLSGGEPTLHPQFFELLGWARDHPHIDYVLLNTNGLRLASENGFATRLGTMFLAGGLQLYLQFDGPQSAGQHLLRGADLRATRLRALERCAEANLPVTLAMTVIPENLPQVWDTIEFGLKHPHVHGVTFQPLVESGRVPAEARLDVPQLLATGAGLPLESVSARPRLNTADIINAAVEHSRGVLRHADFTPLPCGDPNCATIGYLLRLPGGVRSISEFLDFTRLQGFLRDRLQYSLEDLSRCGCETEPLGQALKDLELKSSVAFRIMVKPFMDAWTWDQDRIDRCCTHVIRPDGRLDSFCRYYSGFADCHAAVA